MRLGLVMMGAVVAAISVANAQEIPTTPQRALIIATMAQQLGQAEMKSQALEGQLAQAQKEIEDLKAKCGDACKAPPAK